jgi:hypothetical protein
MALVAEQGNNRLAAVLILVILAIMVYLLCFHWFILRHLDYNSEIADLSDQLGRFERVAAQRTEYETLLQALQERKADENLFLSGNDFNEAAAGMSERLSQMITVQADDSCDHRSG